MSVDVGDALPAQDFPINRYDLVRYAGASGDFNIIHWNERVATSVGLPNVIAHGMFTMASAIRVVTDWAGDPGAVVEHGVRFTRPVPVPDPGEAAVMRMRLAPQSHNRTPASDIDAVIELRRQEADEFYASVHPGKASAEEKNVQRQAFAGMIWTKQCYLFDVDIWLDGDNKH